MKLCLRTMSGSDPSQGIIRSARVWLSLCVLVALSFNACGRRMPSSLETEASLTTTEWLEQRYGLNHSAELKRLLDRVASRLGATVSGRALERESNLALSGSLANQQWEVLVIKTPEPNAFSVGSGIVFVTEGLLARTETEAELAAIISHEMSHQLLGHTREAIQSQSEKLSGSPKFAYSLEREIEADTLGLKMLKVARYDLRYAPLALTLGYRSFDSVVAKPHPRWIDERLANLKQQIAESGEFLPATDTTREFNHVKRQLFG
ncbi:MAG: M48 family metallopeptidase [Bdellovibrionota bacterium]